MQLDQFSGQSFEQLVQALAAHVFGPGLTVFGPGRDGGREATFRGALPGFGPQEWNGYTVIQAKCKERPTGDSRDATWLCGQLRTELQKFVNNEELERPEYYLLCTNVQLSAVPRVGGKDQVDRVFQEFEQVLKLKGWHVWSADELRSLLVDAPRIRQTFASWITPGDILFELMEKLVGPDLKRALPLVLSRELRNDRDARLRDAGQETDQAVYLENVFIDLPVDLPMEMHFPDAIEGMSYFSEEEGPEAVESEEAGDATEFDDEFIQEASFDDLADNCVATLFQLAADRLDPETVDVRRKNKRWALRNRVVILGGPGQGKSTLGQFVVQLARARLLSASDRLSLNPEIRTSVKQICSTAEKLSIPLYGPARMPVRVDLPMLADAMNGADGDGQSVLAFVAKKFSEHSGHLIKVPEMRKLLGEFPWIVIFDGLDEVPPSANRREVVKAIETFWDDVYSVGGDVLCVVTSRPQGYDNDLSPDLWQHWNLLPLTPKYAIEYAEKLGNIRVSELDRQGKILTDIRNACLDPSTALLTTSPLQVTILFGISFLKGSIPQDRWELFDRYYNLLREREAQKPGSTSKLIREHKRTIDDLHQTCGWILQAEAEAPGRTVSYLSDKQFLEIIVHLLKEEGYEGDTVTDLANRLAEIATDRLVLLASRTEGQVSFDVRSLQEYMAAAKLVGSDQYLLVERLRKIASSAHWRHVFRIAVSKIFSVAEMGHLRADVVAICDALDNGDLDESGAFVKAGAVLALDLLADGISANAPRFYRSLLTRAITTLDMDRDAFDPRIVAVVDSEKGQMFFEEIEARLNGADFNAKRNSVATLLMLPHSQRAVELLDNFLGTDPKMVLGVLATLDLGALPKYRNSVRELQKRGGELASSSFIASAIRAEKEGTQNPAELAFLPNIVRSVGLTHAAAITVGLTETTVTRVYPIEVLSRQYREIGQDFELEKWPVLSASRTFAESPSPQTLSACVIALGRLNMAHYVDVIYETPWPLKAMLNELRDGHDCALLAQAAEKGEFGDEEAWLKAENRWRERSLNADDFLSWGDNFYLSADIGSIGVPPLNRVSTGNRADSLRIEELLDVASTLHGSAKRELLLWVAMNSLHRERGATPFDLIKRLLDIFFGANSAAVPLTRRRARIFGLGSDVWTDPRVPDLANRFGMNGQKVPARITELLEAFNANPEMRGLLAHVRSPNLSRKVLDTKVDDQALAVREDDPPLVKSGIILLRLLRNELEGLEPEVSSRYLVGGPPNAVQEAARILKTIREPGDVSRREFAYQLAKQVRLTGKEPKAGLLELLNANVSAAPTDLTRPTVCDGLNLPCLSSS